MKKNIQILCTASMTSMSTFMPLLTWAGIALLSRSICTCLADAWRLCHRIIMSSWSLGFLSLLSLLFALLGFELQLPPPLSVMLLPGWLAQQDLQPDPRLNHWFLGNE